MKKIFLPGILGLLLWCCQNEVRENPPERGDYFVVGCNFKFYFVDDEGRDLLDFSPGEEIPFTLFEFTKSDSLFTWPQHSLPVPSLAYSYNNGCNTVAYDTEKGLYYWTSNFEGYKWVNESILYVQFKETDTDTLRVRFNFVERCTSGDGICPEIRDVYYNSRQVVRNSDYKEEEGIWIRKKAIRDSL